MNLTSADLDDDLWRFALRFYRRPGIAPACLTLQDRLGLDVNILIVALFAQLERNSGLHPDEIAAADALVSQWRGSVVQALRRVRTELKQGPAPAPSPATDLLREEVNKLELRAEQIQLAVLGRWLDERGPAAVQADRPDDPVPAVARHFATAEDRLSEPDVARAVQTISEEARAWRAAKTNT